MRIQTLFTALLPLSMLAQTTHTVQVGGSLIGGTPPFYSPQHITIEVGDIVQWNNVSGTHNVNGSTTLFPANPQGFSSGSPQGGNWTFSFTFTIPGVYNYHCTQSGHSATQFGSITVNSSIGLDEVGTEASIQLYPNPTDEVLLLEDALGSVARVEVIAMNGSVMRVAISREEGRIRLDTSLLPAGRYVARMHSSHGDVLDRTFLKR